MTVQVSCTHNSLRNLDRRSVTPGSRRLRASITWTLPRTTIRLQLRLKVCSHQTTPSPSPEHWRATALIFFDGHCDRQNGLHYYFACQCFSHTDQDGLRLQPLRRLKWMELDVRCESSGVHSAQHLSLGIEHRLVLKGFTTLSWHPV